MKFIFDFDDVLFLTTKHRVELMFHLLEENGIPRDKVEEYYQRERWNQLSLKKMLKHFSVKESLYEEIMGQSKNFLNEELLKIIKEVGKDNCFLVTYGEKDFQKDKLRRTNVAPYFSEITIVPGSKKEAVENICLKFKNEKVLFIDDKAQHFADLDYARYPNLKTILFDEKGLEKLKAEIGG